MNISTQDQTIRDDSWKSILDHQPKSIKFVYWTTILTSWISPCSVYFMTGNFFKQAPNCLDKKLKQEQQQQQQEEQEQQVQQEQQQQQKEQEQEQKQQQGQEQQKSKPLKPHRPIGTASTYKAGSDQQLLQSEQQPEQKPDQPEVQILIDQDQHEQPKVTQPANKKLVSKKLMFTAINLPTIIQLLIISAIALTLSCSNLLQTSEGGPIIHCFQNTSSPNATNQTYSWVKICSSADDCQSDLRSCKEEEQPMDLVLKTVIPKIILPLIFASLTSSIALQMMGIQNNFKIQF